MAVQLFDAHFYTLIEVGRTVRALAVARLGWLQCMMPSLTIGHVDWSLCRILGATADTALFTPPIHRPLLLRRRACDNCRKRWGRANRGTGRRLFSISLRYHSINSRASYASSLLTVHCDIIPPLSAHAVPLFLRGMGASVTNECCCDSSPQLQPLMLRRGPTTTAVATCPLGQRLRLNTLQGHEGPGGIADFEGILAPVECAQWAAERHGVHAAHMAVLPLKLSGHDDGIPPVLAAASDIAVNAIRQEKGGCGVQDEGVREALPQPIIVPRLLHGAATAALMRGGELGIDRCCGRQGRAQPTSACSRFSGGSGASHASRMVRCRASCTAGAITPRSAASRAASPLVSTSCSSPRTAVAACDGRA